MSLLQIKFERPLTLPTFAKLVRSLKEDCKQAAIGHLFRLIDKDQRGTINLSELMDFSISYDRDMDILYCFWLRSFRIIARSLQLDGMNTSKLFFLNELAEEEEVQKKQFLEIMA